MEKAFYYLHIPKTAGATFCFCVLPKLFTAAETCPAHDYPELLPIPGTELARYRLFRGHFYYFLERLLPFRPAYLTFLRDPVERTLSLFDHICRDVNHYDHHEMRALENGLADAAARPDLLPPNFQVTALACDLDPAGTMDRARAEHPGASDEYSVIYREMIKRCPAREDLALAQRRVEAMEFVGITEQFDQSVELLCRTFGWAAPSYESINIAPKRTLQQAIPTDTLNRIRAANQLDYELYEFAKSLFHRRLADAHLASSPRYD